MESPWRGWSIPCGDRVFSVNGVNIIGKAHSETIALIKQYENHVVFMVVSEADHAAWIAAERTPNEWDAKPYWQKAYGALGDEQESFLF